MRIDIARIGRGRPLMFVGIALFLTAGLAACGAATASNGTSASATATPNCTRTRVAQTATGTISNVTATSFQVTSASGMVTTVQISSNTRISKIVTVSASSLTAGAAVQVVPDASGTTAQRIVVTPQGANGFGGRGGGGGATGTPGAGFNPACVATRTPGRGGFGGNAQGVRGTVASASDTNVVVNDPQGQTLTFTITPSTQILSTATGSASDLKAGSTVTVTGTLSGATLVARTIVVQSLSAA